jgi:amino acid adenylation domain-containing protein
MRHIPSHIRRIQELFELQVMLQPTGHAISDGTTTLTYQQLNEQVNRLAHYLHQQGIKSGEKISIFTEKSIEAMVAILAILKVGAVYVPLSPESSNQTVEHILKEIDFKLAFGSSSSIDRIHSLSRARVNIVALEEIATLTSDFSSENLNVVSECDQAYVIYTSGTTGHPKGVLVNHHSLLHTYNSWKEIYQLNSNDVHLQMANFSFDVFTGDWIRALCSGAKLVLCPTKLLLNPPQLYHFIVQQRINCAEFVPAVLRLLSGFIKQHYLPLRSFRLLLCGSDKWTMKEYRLAQHLFAPARVISSYGSTETTIDSTFFEETSGSSSIGSLPDSAIVPIGKPFEHTNIYILDSTGKAVKEGETGEIYIGGAGVAHGYLGRAELTRERFLPDAFTSSSNATMYKTGDIGQRLKDGNFAFLGRSQMHIKINGHRVDISEIEAIINAHPKVNYGVVIPVETLSHVVLKCFCIFNQETSMAQEELVDYLHQHLPSYCIPHEFYEIEETALTVNGKINRNADAQVIKRKIEPKIIIPRDNLEIQLADIWKEVLGIDEVGIENKFFDLGGNSLLFVNMIQKVNEALRIDLPATISALTINELSEKIQQFLLSCGNNLTPEQESLRVQRIAIIGGGPAGLSACIEIFKKIKAYGITRRIEVSVFEKSPVIGHGLPYSKSEDCYILNLSKEVMEPSYGEAGHFSRWLKEIKEAPQDTDFPPRHYFGKYLEYLGQNLLKKQYDGSVRIYYHTNTLVKKVIRKSDNHFQIETTKGYYKSDYAILCTGHMPADSYREFVGERGYIANPWKNNIFDHINPKSDVAILGTRLTAIDVALKLSSINHQGKIIMVSHTGMLPAVLAKKIPSYPLRHLTLENLSQLTQLGLEPLSLKVLMNLFWREIREAERDPDINFESIKKSYKDISALDWLNKEIAQSESGNPKPWQQVLFAMYPIVPILWSMLTLTDQYKFLNKYQSLFLTYLAAFPLDNAYKIRKLIESKQLEVTGGLADVSLEDGRYSLKLDDRSISAEYLINATGPGYNAAFVPACEELIKQGVVRPHEFGGIDVDSQTLQVLNRYGEPQPKLFAVGELTRGACLATTDMTRVAIQTGRISTCIAHHLLQRPIASSINTYLRPATIVQQAARTVNTMGLFGRRPITAVVTGAIMAAGGIAQHHMSKHY